MTSVSSVPREIAAMGDELSAASLNLTAEEKRVFGQLFRQADTDGIGVVTGEAAVKFFERTRLEGRILGEIWQIADKENRGLLTPAGFGVVLRLIGHCQAGQSPTAELALRPGPLPKFDAIQGAATASFAPPPSAPPPGALQPQTSGSAPIRVPPLTPDKATQYAQLFDKSGPQQGVLPGEIAKHIFERAGLPNEILGRIWNLADTEQRGALVATEFVIAMHLIASFKVGALRALPNILPAGLYEAAARRQPSRQSSGAMPAALAKQMSGGPGRMGSPLQRSGFGTSPNLPQGPVSDWAITPADKVKFDGIYNGLDRNNKGFITGDEAVPFFSESKLPEEALAQIWDLADINSVGHLTRDEFAVAMYLIRQQRSKRDNRESLPTTLPANLIPPSMRHQVPPQNETTAPVFDAPAPTMAKSAADDLFGLDALTSPTPAAAPVQVPQSTGGSTSMSGSRTFNADPFASGPSPISAHTTGQAQPSSMFKSFIPSSSFGQSLTAQATGGSSASGPQQSRSTTLQSSAAEDLLGDNDPEVSRKLTSETSELANLSNQVGNLSKQMQEVKGQRASSQAELGQTAAKKQQFEERLVQLRALYEQEVKDVRTLEERLATSRKETQKLQTDIAMLDATHQDLQNQHRQVATALQADQQENAVLKERMRGVNTEIAQLKPMLEKLRSDARQQKGLVAINKKQLATNEAERDKLNSEAADLKRSIDEDAKILAAVPRTQSPAAMVASPTASVMSATNPFFRQQSSSGNAETANNNTATNKQDASFDSVFGPSFDTTHDRPAIMSKDSDSRSVANSNAALPTRPQASEARSDMASTTSREISGQLEPPPPPESRQISSSFLPFPKVLREDSLSSSRQVSVPNSRFGEESTGASTPTNAPPGEDADVASQHASDRPISADGASDANPSITHKHQDSIPGAFPGDASTEIPATPEPHVATDKAVPDDVFGQQGVTRTDSAKDDFEAAFAGFSASKSQERSNNSSLERQPTGRSGLGTEFPPISELTRDEESDSDSEQGGFDDDFAPESTRHSRNVSSATIGNTANAASASKDYLNARPASKDAPSSTDPPTPNAQASPPSYDKTVAPAERAHAEIQKYSASLPSREPPHATDATTTNSFPMPAGVSAYSALADPAKSQGNAPSGNVAFDDDMDEFADLEDAKEGDPDDEFANMSTMSTQSRPAIDDFNAAFDTPPRSRGNDRSQPQASSFGASSNSTFGRTTQEPSSFAADQLATKGTESHDWDAIFAGLDGPSTAAATSSTSQPSQLAAPTNGTMSTSASTGGGPERPQIGRALTETSMHDDPILKNLTSMGYARNDALQALEKYDYDLQRAANYLASQS